MKKRLMALGMTFALAAFGLAGCGGDDTTTTTSATDDTTLVVSLSSAPSKLDPIDYSGTYEGKIIDQVTDRVIEYNDDLSGFVPSLASSWEISEDGLTYVFQIRDDVYFQPGTYQDGRQMTAEDVAYSLNRSHEFSANNRLDMLGEAVATGEFEVTCTLPVADASFLAALTNAGNSIVPIEEVEGWGDQFGNNLCGTGAFDLIEFKLDEEAILVANEDYFLGAPNIDNLTFKFINDSTQAVNALLTGVVDLATDISGEAINTVAESDDLELLLDEALKINYIRYNDVNGPTADLKVRQALTMAVDFEAVRTALYQYDEVVAGYLPLPYGSWGYDESLEELALGYDLEAAKALMAEAGYEDGFELNIYVSNTQERITLCTLLQAFWAELGITTNITVSEWGPFSEVVCSGNADVYAMSWSWYPDPYFFLNKLFSSDELNSIGNGAGYVNEEVDNLLSLATQVTDQDERAEYYSQAMEIVMGDVTGVYYANPYQCYGTNGTLVDFVARADGSLRFVTPERNTSVAE